MHPDARLRDMVPSAYLRVFQPLDAFDREEQLRWERYLVSNRWVPGRRRRYLDHAKDGLGLIAPADGEHAEVRVVDGRTYVSPWRMRMRVLAAAPGVPRDPADRALRAVPLEEGREARGPRAEAAPAARPPRGGLLSPEPVARADPVVRALRGRGALARGGRARPTPPPVSHDGAPRAPSCGPDDPAPAPGRTSGRSATS